MAIDTDTGEAYLKRFQYAFEEFDADLYWIQAISTGGMRRCYVKVFGVSNPWAAIRHLERLCAESPLVYEVGMMHTHLKGYGK